MHNHMVNSLQLINGNNAEKTRPDDATEYRPTHLKVWEIDDFFKCPIVGMCLTLPEQKQLLKKSGISFKQKSSFEIHEIFVANSDEKNPLSQKVDTFLDRRFSQHSRDYKDLAEDEFMEHWRRHFASGDFKGIFWVAATRSDLSVDARREIFGAVHMAMHENAADIAKLKQAVALAQRIAEQATQKHKRDVEARKALLKEKTNLERTLNDLQRELVAIEKDNARLGEDLSTLKSSDYELAARENQILRDERQKQSLQMQEYRDLLTDVQKENQRLAMELNGQRELNLQARTEMQAVIQQCLDMTRCTKSCPAFDLCKKRVLIVGGMSRMESLYRDLIEGSGGIFEHHDGDLKSGVSRLENCLKRADIVLCPVNCNSHGACSLVKKLGKKHNKPVHMLSNSSLTTVTQLIWGNQTTGHLEL